MKNCTIKNKTEAILKAREESMGLGPDWSGKAGRGHFIGYAWEHSFFPVELNTP